MINPIQKLNPKLFDLIVERVPIRDGFGEGVEAGEKNQQVVLCADLVESTRIEKFAKRSPERFVEIVAEQNCVTVASGLAAMVKSLSLHRTLVFHPAAIGSKSARPLPTTMYRLKLWVPTLVSRSGPMGAPTKCSKTLP